MLVEELLDLAAKVCHLKAESQTIEVKAAQEGCPRRLYDITDFAQIAAYGVMTTPALVVDGKVVSYGKVLKAEEVRHRQKTGGNGIGPRRAAAHVAGAYLRGTGAVSLCQAAGESG